jgi:hypothetical protein
MEVCMDRTVRRRLVDVLPPEFTQGRFENSPAMPHVFVDVLETYRATERPWPGKHKNVAVWYVLADGKAIGFNENKQRGWSFPVITYPPLPRSVPMAREDGPEPLLDMPQDAASKPLQTVEPAPASPDASPSTTAGEASERHDEVD